MADDAVAPNAAWDVKQYEASLAHLETLQDQLTALRTTIPSLIRPLARPNTTRSEAFHGMKKAAIGAVTEVKSFRNLWDSEQTQQILAKAKDSRAKDADLSAGKEVPAYGWTDGYTGPVVEVVEAKVEEGEQEIKSEEVVVVKEEKVA